MKELLNALETIKKECNKYESCQNCPLFSPESDVSICGVCCTPYNWNAILNCNKLQ